MSGKRERDPAERIEAVTKDVKRMADNFEGSTRPGPVLLLLIGFGLWVAFQGTTKNGVVGCSDMPGGDNWDAITRPRR
jgi:hypothetical protein